VKYVFDAHTSKASKRLKVVLLHLWRENAKTTGGFICISFGDFHIDKTTIPKKDPEKSAMDFPQCSVLLVSPCDLCSKAMNVLLFDLSRFLDFICFICSPVYKLSVKRTSYYVL
jgi:hypothetical protein